MANATPVGLGPWERWRPLVEARLRSSAAHRPEKYGGAELPAYARPLLDEIRELHRRLA